MAFFLIAKVFLCLHFYSTLKEISCQSSADKLSRSTLCLCQNGGTCLKDGSCVCPSGTTGSYCEIESESTGKDCNLRITGAGAYNCTISTYGTACDITCDNVHQGQYLCRSGTYWRPQLPYCTSPKEPRKTRQASCRCENGGTCDGRGRCVCPSRFTGSRCENDPSKTCPVPGSIESGYIRFNYRKQATSGGRTSSFRDKPASIGDAIQYYCNLGYELRGNNVRTCLITGRWSSEKPSCEATTIDSTTYCSDPGYIPNGSFLKEVNSSSNQRYVVGQYVNYYCLSGYDLVGSRIVTCENSGEWSSKPVCRRRRLSPTPLVAAGPSEICSDPGVLQSGYRRLVNGTPNKSTRSYNIGQSFQYFCNQGYQLIGNNILTCTGASRWSSALPTCVSTTTVAPMSCRYPDQSTNSILTTPARVDQIFAPRAELIYACYVGYETKDPLIIYCLSSGQWSSPPPTCRRVEKPSQAVPSCVLPHIDLTGMITNPVLDTNDLGRSFPPGTELKFDCEEGYELEGDPWIIYCKLDGEWTADLPRCRTLAAAATPHCSYPGVDENGIIEDDNAAVIIGQTQMYPPGAELKYLCIDGYEVEGVSNLVCKLSGYWSDDPPICIARAPIASPPVAFNRICPPPIVDRNGDMENIAPNDRRRVQGFEAGVEVSFTCNSGYELTGTSPIVCLRIGQWSNEPPTCTSISRTSGVLCTDPGSVQNGGVIVYYNNPNVRRLPNPERYNALEYPVGSRLSYDCSIGYRLEGEKTLDCKSTGRWSGVKPRCVEDCGRSTLRAGGKVTYGTNTTAGEFPWVVFLFMNETRQTCGGVLLDRRTVLSAAHCFGNVEYCTIFFGKYNKSVELDDKHVISRRSSEIIVHPNFVPATFNNDIAIVKFSPDVPFSPRVQPICMPTPSTTAVNIVPNKNGTVSGWGLNEKRVESPTLMLANLPVQAPETCMAAYRKKNRPVSMTQGMFCAGYPNDRINACEGDSGSPLVFYNSKKERFVVEGLVSHGMSGRCDLPEKYTMFTRVSNFLQWINRNWKTGNR